MTQTLKQRHGIAAYAAANRDAIYHAERTPRSLHRAAMNAPMERVVVSVKPADPEPITLRQLVTMSAIWLGLMAIALWLCTSAGMAFLDALWSLK